MRSSDRIAIVAIFTALIVGSDFALAPALNVKLLDSLVFLSAMLFGFRTGAAIAVLSETIWSFVSPWGMAGLMLPFLVAGELIFVLAGWSAARIWGRSISIGSPASLFIGATMAVCAFAWDFETNLGTGLLAGANTFLGFLAYELQGVPFMIPHEISDFLLGALFVPLAIPLVLQRLNGRVLGG
jgi:uncharacterized membrane protein